MIEIGQRRSACYVSSFWGIFIKRHRIAPLLAGRADGTQLRKFSMPVFLVLVLLVCVIFTGCLKGSKPGWSTASGAEQFERLMWDAIRAKDWREVEYHLAPTFVGVDVGGQQYDRMGWLEHWKAAPIQDFSLGELTVHPNGPDMVLTYEIQVRGEQSGQSVIASGTRVISVWQQLKDGWVLISQSRTPIR